MADSKTSAGRDLYTEFEEGERVCLRGKDGRPYRIGSAVRDTEQRRFGVAWECPSGQAEWTWPDEWQRLERCGNDERVA